MPKPQTPLVARLKALRARHGLTQEECAALCGIGYKYYQHIEQGQNVDLRLSTLTKLATAYGIRVDQLLSPKMPRTRILKESEK